MLCLPTRRVRRDQMLASEQRKAHKLVGEYLLSIGAVGPDKDDYYVVSTILGPLTVSPMGDWIHCRWHDVERAVERIGRDCMNPYSGKWNHHYFGRDSAESVVERFRLVLQPYLMRAGQPAPLSRRDKRERFNERMNHAERYIELLAKDDTADAGERANLFVAASMVPGFTNVREALCAMSGEGPHPAIDVEDAVDALMELCDHAAKQLISCDHVAAHRWAALADRLSKVNAKL